MKKKSHTKESHKSHHHEHEDHEHHKGHHEHHKAHHHKKVGNTALKAKMARG